MWTTRWMMRLDEAYEKRTIAAASLLSTVSEPIARHLESSLGIRCETIYNGFEVEPETPELRPVDDDRFDLVYTGGIYRKYYDPTPMFRVLRKLRDEGELPARFCLHFYGQSAEFPRLEGWLDEFGIADLVERHGTLSRDDVARVQREAHALFFLAWTNENADGVLSGKLFEYFAAGRPILSVGCGLKPAVGQLIARTGTGVVVRDETDGVLEQALRTLVRGETPDWFKPDTGAIETFRRDVQGGKVVELAEALVEEKKY
jgi:glycosyltransferase involved in cell wall biosynthesis